MEPYRDTPKSHPAVPIAIVVGFAMVALAIFFTSDKSTESKVVTENVPQEDAPAGTVRPVDGTDFIKGNPNAPILMIEYSDYDCPFCKEYHETLTQIMNVYGVTGKVAWVYRQFPIAKLHPNAPKITEAALCVGALGGSDAFWKFTDAIFLNREATEQTNMLSLPEYATDAGVDMGAYQNCIASGEKTAAVEAAVKEAFDLGARGTPYTVIIVGSEQAVINGAQPYEVVDSIIQNLISQLEGTYTGTTTPPQETTS